MATNKIPNGKQSKGGTNPVFIFLTLFLVVMLGIYAFGMGASSSTVPYDYSDLVSDIKTDSGRIESLTIESNVEQVGTGTAIVQLNGEDGFRKIDIPNVETFTSLVHEYNLAYTIETTKTGQFNQYAQLFLLAIIAVLLFGIVAAAIPRGGGGDMNKSMNFGKSRHKMFIDTEGKVTFKDVAGLEEEKIELKEVVDFLKDPKKFNEIGARIPKGVLLVGPPGTGKTLLAKAVAGEASVPFLSISGSDFVEMFVGVGASRVRDLFETAKKNAPCLIFIDEIDAVGRRRGSGHGGGHDEREQTLNQMLVEMDGFGVNEGIIVLAATNRVDILDPAILRPGRFDRKVNVDLPDVSERLDIIHVHTRKKKVSSELDYLAIAQTTSGLSGADIENLMNEAALISVRAGKKEVDMESVAKAFIKIGIGTEKTKRIVTDKDKKITAYHEAGHAIAQEVLSELSHVHMVSIIPTGTAGGYTMHIPMGEYSYTSKTKLEQEIISLLSGRAAEELIFNEITTGASSDISRATSIATSMVTKFGMSILGPIKFNLTSSNPYDGSSTPKYSEEIAAKIDEEVSKFIEIGYKRALEILTEHRDVLDRSATLLLEKEKINGSEFRSLFAEGVLPVKEESENITSLLKNMEVEIEKKEELAKKEAEANKIAVDNAVKEIQKASKVSLQKEETETTEEVEIKTETDVKVEEPSTDTKTETVEPTVENLDIVDSIDSEVSDDSNKDNDK